MSYENNKQNHEAPETLLDEYAVFDLTAETDQTQELAAEQFMGSTALTAAEVIVPSEEAFFMDEGLDEELSEELGSDADRHF